MCHGLVNLKFLVQWTHILLLNVNSFWGLYVFLIYKLWEQTFCPACVYTCVGSSLIIRVFIVHVSIDCQTVRISLVKWTLKLSELTNVKVDVYLSTWIIYNISWYLAIKVLLRLFFDMKIKELRMPYIQKFTL